MGECVENSLSNIKFYLNFFLWCWIMPLEYLIKCKLIFYKEMGCDGVKSNVAKWNLIGRIQFKHMKHCLMFM